MTKADMWKSNHEYIMKEMNILYKIEDDTERQEKLKHVNYLIGLACEGVVLEDLKLKG